MRRIKIAMIAIAAFGSLPVIVGTPVRTLAAAHFFSWPKFWQRFFSILLTALERYLEVVIRRGYFRVSVPANPIVTAFSNQTDINLAAEKGLVYDGHMLTVPEDIVIYVQDETGVALQKGEYQQDAAGNFQFNLIRVIKPAPSPTFPIPEGGGR